MRLVTRTARYCTAAILTLCLLAASPAGASVPAAIQPPAGNNLSFTLHGVGFQIYTCSAAGTWTLYGPLALLIDSTGSIVGYHSLDTAYGLPSWTNFDGSHVVAKKIASAPSPTGAIPWLLLQTVATIYGPSWGGDTTYVQRTNTVGGLAPVGACSPTASKPFLSPYSATYSFFHGS